MADETKQFKIGHYGAGTLSVLRNDAGQFILLGSLTIARQSEETGTWVSFAPGWKPKVRTLSGFSSVTAKAWLFRFPDRGEGP